MLGLEKLADKFDYMHNENLKMIRRELQGWVNDQYNNHGEGARFYGAAVTAGVLDAVYDFLGMMGGGMVDTLRIGQGVSEGTAWGVAKDGLRVVSLAGGALRVARVGAVSLTAGGRMSCMLTSLTKAVRFSSVRKMFVPLGAVTRGMLPQYSGSVAKAIATNPAFRGGSAKGFFDLINHLKIMGVRVNLVQSIKSLADVERLARNSQGPITFLVRWKNGGGHVMTAYRGIGGVVRYMDQATSYGKISKLAPLVGHVEAFAAVFEEAAVFRVAGVAAIALPFYEVGSGTWKKVFAKVDQMKGRAPDPKKALNMELREARPLPYGDVPNPPAVQYWTYKVSAGDSLEYIAQRVYGDRKQAKKIFDANSRTIGPPPKYLIHPGQVLVIPD